MKKKLTAAVLCLILIGSVAGTALCLPASPKADSVGKITKDETVYITLDGAGAKQEIDVVNHIETPKAGVYTDYGDYDQTTNLTNGTKPQVDGSAISWQLDANSDGFYYQGRLKQGEPPFLFTVHYLLDGIETPAADMAGKSGKVAIHIDAQPNTAANSYFTKNYFCQIQAALNLDHCRDITAASSTGILTGRTKNLGFTVMPGKTASFEIDFTTDDFSFDGFTITAMPFDQKSMAGIDTSEINGDIKKMSDGTQSLVDGTKELKDGLAQLSGGVKSLSNGAGSATSGMSKYKSGLKSYTGGVAELAANARKISAGMQALAANGQQLKAGFAQMNGGLTALFTQLAPMLPPATAGQIAALQGQLSGYQQGLDSYIDGVSAMAAGMKSFAAGLDQLGSSWPSLVSGLTAIVSGMSQLSDGLSKTATEMNKLPDAVQKLIDGQTQLKDGVDTASQTFAQWNFGTDSSAAPVSFTSQQNSPRSVQFIYKTPQIAKAAETKAAEPAQPQKSFFQKLADLFR